MEVSEEKVLAKLSATKRAIDETISNQHADIEAKVQVLKDNVAICMAGAGGASKKGTAIATPKSTKSMTKQESAERVLSMVDSFDESRPPSAPQSAVLNHTSEKIEIVAGVYCGDGNSWYILLPSGYVCVPRNPKGFYILRQ